MLAPRFDLVDIEFRFGMSQEVCQVHFGRRRIVISLVSTRNEIAEGIGSDGNSLVWRGRKLQVGSGASCFGDLQTGPKHRSCRGGCGLGKKMSSRGGRQSGDSLAESDRRRYEEVELHSAIQTVEWGRGGRVKEQWLKRAER